jgi:alpha-ribazole phosphatase
MALYLVRHTKPDIIAGTCYGQADIDVAESFLEEANALQHFLPKTFDIIYSSPLQRCHKLATHCFPKATITNDNRIMEVNCGEWEMKLWNDIPRTETDPWMEDFVNQPFKGGENYVDLQTRVVTFFNEVFDEQKDIIVFTHAGVKRSLLSYINNVALVDSFNAFVIPYGSITKITNTNSTWQSETIYAKEFPKEQHRPT